MTIYEQIQRALDYIEGGLSSRLRRDRAAREAGMSSRSFDHWFWAVMGHSFKEYVKRRRLAEAQALLAGTEARVIDIALDVGYGSHEAFSRAFKAEFGVSPLVARKVASSVRGLLKPNLIKEMYMGVVIKELPGMFAATFDGFGQDSESKAHEKLESWAKDHPSRGRPRRVFGYNIDLEGNLDSNPRNVGYRVLATIDDRVEAGGARSERIHPGKFAVTGIEGSADDGTGQWIMDGWKRMNDMIKEKGFKAKKPIRWFEEELEPSAPGNFRLDLYLEIE
jgi:AraC family transcriptional regulator